MRCTSYAVFAVALAFNAGAQASGKPLDLAYRADQPSLRLPASADPRLPHLLEDGTVMLQFSTDISALRQIRRVSSGSGSTSSSIESPELDTRNFLQRVAMKSNETLIISGFEQTDDDLDRQGVGHPANLLFGGSLARKTSKEVIVILVTPTTMAGS